VSDSKTTTFTEADWLRLVRYLDGDLTSEETRALERWLADRPDRSELFARLREEWEGAGLTPGAARWDVDAAVGELAERMTAMCAAPPATMRSAERCSERLSRHFGNRVEKRGWLGHRFLRGRTISARAGLAAVVLGLVTFGVSRLIARVPHRVTRGHTYASAIGQRAIIRLSDGTRVTLAPGTKLVVSPGFGRDDRHVMVDGEAAFDVDETERRPFIVSSGDVTTRVLGTHFAVRQAAGVTQIVVASGKISVTSHSSVRGNDAPRTVVLSAGGLLRITDSTIVSTTVRDPQPYLVWEGGRLVFRDTPVPEVLATLGRWYGYNFRLADRTLSARHINAVFDGAPAEEMLRTLRIVLDATFSVVPGRADQDGSTRGVPTIVIQPRETAEPAADRRQLRDSFILHSGVGR
jgi:ferric-dicitrate binding protein FerR (iron transport regulator)